MNFAYILWNVLSFDSHMLRGFFHPAKKEEPFLHYDDIITVGNIGRKMKLVTDWQMNKDHQIKICQCKIYFHSCIIIMRSNPDVKAQRSTNACNQTCIFFSLKAFFAVSQNFIL